MEPRQTVIFRWLAAGDTGDFNAFDLLLHPDAVVHAPAGLSTTSCEAEKQVWREGKKAIPDIRHDVQEVVVAGDVEMARVVVSGRLTSVFGGIEGTGSPRGTPSSSWWNETTGSTADAGASCTIRSFSATSANRVP